MTHTDFYPTDTKADPAQIRRSAEGLRAISGVLLGQGDDVDAVLSDVALSFSEVIAAAVKAQIGNNAVALETAVEGTQYGYAVGSAWAEDVESFKAARQALIVGWEAAEMDDFGVEPPLNLWPAPEPEETERLRLEHRVDIEDARRVCLDGFIREGNALWESFQERAIEAGRMFREGPTAENLALVVSYLGWGAMTLWPEFAPPPVSAGVGVTAGTTVLAGIDGTAGPQAVTDALSDVAAIARRAAAGERLTPEEIDFLAAFYQTVGQRITEVPDYLAQTSFEYTTSQPASRADGQRPPIYTSHTVDGLDPAMVGALSAASANGMLVLSRGGLGGGGYERLPTWVRDALDGDEIQTQPFSPTTSPPMIGVGSDIDQMSQLAEFLRHSTVEAGTGLSHQLATTTQDLIRLTKDGEYYFLDDTIDVLTEQVDSIGGSFLSVVARNEEACYDLLGDEDMPPGYDPTTFLADIYRFEWSDDGDSAAHLTDFIADWKTNGTTDDVARADAAMGRLVEMTTSDELFGALMDGVGTSGDPGRSALGLVNPAVTAQLGGLMVTYLNEFSGLSADSPIAALGTLNSVRFATLICTDDASAAALISAVNSYETEILGDYPTAVGVNEFGGAIGRLHGVLDSGLMNASMDVTGDGVHAAERAYQVRQFAFGLVDGAANALAPPFSVVVGAASGLIAAGDGPADVVTPDDLDAENYQSETMVARQYDTSAAALQSMIDADLVEDSALAVLRDLGLVVGDSVFRAPADAVNVEAQTDLLAAATDTAAAAAGLDLPPVQLLIGDIEETYAEILRRYQAENPEEYEQLIEG